MSCRGGLSTDRLGEVLRGADLGIALYKPTFQDIYTGKNLEYIGLASGKFSTYLQNGLPVMVDGGGLMADLTLSEGLGVVVEEHSQIPATLSGLATEGMRGASRQAFLNHLDARNHIDAFEQLLLNSIDRFDQPENAL